MVTCLSLVKLTIVYMCMTVVVRRKLPLALREVVSYSLNHPYGIDISGEVVYVAEWGGHRIHKLTTGGEYIGGTFGEEGCGIGQFF